MINQTPVAFKEWKGAGFGLNSKLRIIWNLTNQCIYDCPICATNSGKDKVCKIDHEKKKSILLSLSSINGFIEKLDVSGGDPLLDPKDRKLIRLINQSFPYSKVTVTTTSEGLERMSANELVETVRECDITYDIPYSECIPTCREYAYNLNNIRKLEQLRNSGINIEFNIHIPIHPQTTKEEMIESILEDLYRIQPKSIKFIRLMPVGRMGKESIKNYQPEKFLSIVKEIAKSKKYDFDMSLNCSLRVKCGKTKCNMKREKIGIDCDGNVFTCIWGAYIPNFLNNIKDNPFYLGNLLEETMYEILTSPKSIKYFKDKKEPVDYCRVCSYVYNNDMDNPEDGLKNFEFDWE